MWTREATKQAVVEVEESLPFEGPPFGCRRTHKRRTSAQDEEQHVVVFVERRGYVGDGVPEDRINTDGTASATPGKPQRKRGLLNKILHH
jgi:hypothetical protein